MRLAINNGNYLNKVFFRHAEIININYSEDFADIVLLDNNEHYYNVPIFFHCFPEATLLPTGSIEGSSSAFEVGDLVVVYFNNKSPTIVGHLNNIKSCRLGCLWGDGLYSIVSGKKENNSPLFIQSFEEDKNNTHQQYVFSNTIELDNYPITFIKHIHITFRPYDFSIFGGNRKILSINKDLFILFKNKTIHIQDDEGDYYIDFNEQCIKIVINDSNTGLQHKIKLNPKGEIIDHKTYGFKELPEMCYIDGIPAKYTDLKVYFYDENRIILYPECERYNNLKPYFLTTFESFPFILETQYIHGQYKYAHIIFDKDIFTHQVYKLEILQSYSRHCEPQNCTDLPPEVPQEGEKEILNYYFPFLGQLHIVDIAYLHCNIYIHCSNLKCSLLEYRCFWGRNSCSQNKNCSFTRDCPLYLFDDSCLETGDGVFFAGDRYFWCTSEQGVFEGYEPYERQYSVGFVYQGEVVVLNGTLYFYNDSTHEEAFLLLQSPYWSFNGQLTGHSLQDEIREIILSYPYTSFCYGELNIKNKKYAFSSFYQKDRTGNISFSFDSNFEINPPPYPVWIIGNCLVL